MDPDDNARTATAPLELPRANRVLPLHLVCIQLPGQNLTFEGLTVTPLILAVGERGRDPDVVWPANGSGAVIDTHLSLAPGENGDFTVDGPYLTADPQHRALQLQWGTRTPEGHFLLLTGLQLRLPRLLASTGYRGRASGTCVLTATVAMTDLTGELRTGVLPAQDLRWQLLSAAAHTRRDFPLSREPRTVVPSIG